MPLLSVLALWGGYIAFMIYLTRKGRGHDSVLSGPVKFSVQALAYVATYISSVALVGFGGLSHKYGMQVVAVAAGVAWLGTWAVYAKLAWPTRQWQQKLGVRTPAQLLAYGHNAPGLRRFFGAIFALLLAVYASAVIKGAAIMMVDIIPVELNTLVWIVAVLVGLTVYIGGMRGVLYTEAMQGAVMLVGIVMLTAAVFAKVGGPVEGMRALAALEPDKFANNGFLALSSGDQGMFIISLVLVTSISVWSQPQMIQRHFALADKTAAMRSAPLAMLVASILLGGVFFSSALSRVFIPTIESADKLVPHLVGMLLPEVGRQLFILAIVSASLSTATALYHIAVAAMVEDIPGKQTGRSTWLMGIIACVVIAGGSAGLKGALISMVHVTSWTLIAASSFVPYLMLVVWGKQSSRGAWCSAVGGSICCMAWYLLAYPQTALVTPVLGSLGAKIPPFVVGVGASALCWWLQAVLMPERVKEEEEVTEGAV